MVAYHDTEWGVPVHDDSMHFEFLVLEGAQAGLSWSTILKRRAGYRKAFAGFDAAKVARFTPARVEKLLRRPRHHPQPGQGRVHRAQRPACSSTCRRSSAPSTPTSGASWAGARWSTNGVAWRSSPRSARVRGLQRRPAPARLRLRRPDRLLRPPAGVGAGQRPPGGLLPLRGAHRRRTHQDAGAEAGHDGLLGRQAVGAPGSRRRTRARRSPPRRRTGRSTGRRGRWPA